MNLSTNKFRKVSSDKKSTVLEHPRGHKITIAHEGLTSKMREQLDSLPLHLADGTPDAPVQDPNDFKKPDEGPQYSTEQQPQQPGVNININAQPNQPQQVAEAVPPQPHVVPAQNIQATPTVMPQMAQQQVPQNPFAAQTQAIAQAQLGGQAMQEAGILGQAKVIGAQGQAEAEASRQQQQNLMKLQDEHRARYKQIDSEVSGVVQDMKNGHINPNQYLENPNRGTGSKVLAALSLLVSGAGAGATGQPNMAMDFLNKQIDRNIDAQKTDLGRQNNVLSALLHQQGNLHDATQMYRAIELDNYAAKLKEMAGKYAGPAAQQAALMNLGVIEKESATLKGNLAFKQALFGGYNGQPPQSMPAGGTQQAPGGSVVKTAGGAPAPQQSGQNSIQNMDPALLVDSFVPKEHQKDVFKEIEDAQNAAKIHDEFMSQFAQAAKENTALRTGAGFLRTPAPILRMRALALPLIHSYEGKVSEFEQKTLDDLMPAPGDTEDKIESKRQGMEAFLTQKESAPRAKGFGIDLSQFNSTSSDKTGRLTPEQKELAQWARNHPEDKRSAMVLKKLGL